MLLRDAHVLYANVLLSDNRAQEAAALLEKDRQPVRAEIEFALGRAYAASGQPAKASEIYRNLYFNMPLSPEADQAQIELNKLPATNPIPAANFTDRKTRADLLLKGKRYSEAATDYSDILTQAAPADRASLQLALATAMRRASRNKEAQKALESLSGLPPEMEAERLFNLSEIARSSNDEDGFFRYLEQLRQIGPTSSWLEQALLSGGNIYLLKPDYDRAIDLYRELQQRFPSGSHAGYAHWKVAWLSLRQGRNAEAKQEFEQQIALYPASVEAPAALYWRGRLAEEDNDTVTASAYYQKVSSRFQNYYYGELSRRRSAKIPKGDEPAHIALLDRIPGINANSRVAPDPVPSDNLRVQKAQLLENGALADFSVRELQAAAKEEQGNWLPAETARLYQDMGRYDVAMDVLKRAVP